jgi:predicted PurR-regulated permease PerM
MLGFDARAARITWSVFLVGLLLVVVYYIRSVLLVFVLAILLAYLLSPVVKLVDRFIPYPRSRIYALALVYVLLVAILIGGGILVGSQVAQEASNLASGFPKLVEGLKQKLDDPMPAWSEPVRHSILAQLNERGRSLSADVLPVLQEIGAQAVSLLRGAVVALVLIPVLSFLFLKDGRQLREQVLALLGVRRPLWEDVAADLHTLLGQFMRAVVILSLVTLVVYSVFFVIIGLPYPVLLASVAALLEFVPVVGPVTAAVIIVLAAAFSGGGHMVAVLVFLVAARMFQDYFVSPHLMSSRVKLHPLLVIFGALAGGALAGIPGMFLSVPVLATLRVVYVRVRKARAVAAAAA